MIRIVRNYGSKPGKLSELLELANGVKALLDSQGVPVSIFTEPYGDSGRLHWHVDYDDAKTAHDSNIQVLSGQRGEEIRAGLDALTDGQPEISLLFEEE